MERHWPPSRAQQKTLTPDPSVENNLQYWQEWTSYGFSFGISPMCETELVQAILYSECFTRVLILIPPLGWVQEPLSSSTWWRDEKRSGSLSVWVTRGNRSRCSVCSVFPHSTLPTSLLGCGNTALKMCVSYTLSGVLIVASGWFWSYLSLSHIIR